MDEICKRIREQIPELIDEGLSPEKAVELEQHRGQCQACNEYFQALEADDRLLCEFAESMQPNVARLENTTMDELRRRKLRGAIKTASIGKRILNNRAAQIAAAILIVAGILVGVVVFGDYGKRPAEIVDSPPEEPEAIRAELPYRDDLSLESMVETELLELRHMIAASDIAGVMTMLQAGQPQSKIEAANCLARIGDERAIGVLAQLAAEWQGEAARNPFAAAIAQIMTRLQEQESEAGDGEEDTVVAETTKVDEEQDVGCKGVVVDEQGHLIAGARVLLYHNRSRWGLGNRVMEETTSAADGSFACRQRPEFTALEQLSRTQETDRMTARHSEYVLLATHPDYAFGWRNIRQGMQQDSYDIVLTRPIYRGIVVTDEDENPLAGVRIWLHNAGDSASPKAVFRDELTLAANVGFVGSTTDAAGRAVIKNLPDTYCGFRTTLKGYAMAIVSPIRRITRISLSRGASVSGWVLAEEDKPAAEATISFKPDWWHHHFLAVTDNRGYFHLEGLPAKGWNPTPWKGSEGASGSYAVTIKHKQCAAQAMDLTLLPGQSIDDFLIKAYSDTTLVECKVVEFGTDVPVAGARIHGWNRIGEFSGYSDSEGILTIRVLPGPVRLSFHSPPSGVYVLEWRPAESLLDFDATGEKMTVTLETPPIAGLLRSVSGIVIGPDSMVQSDGETVVYAGAGKIKTSVGGSTERPVRIDDDGRFVLKEIPAGQRLHLYVETKDRLLAATDVFEIPDDPDWSGFLAVNLEATQSASVVIRDEDGDIIPDRSFNINPIVEGEPIWSVDIKGWTDENGLLELDGIVPGLEYYLTSIEPEMNDESPGLSVGAIREAISQVPTLKMVLVPLETR